MKIADPRLLFVLWIGIEFSAVPSAFGTSRKGIVHRVRGAAETCSALAERYYGDAFFGRHLCLFNRSTEKISRSTTIVVPTSRWITVDREETLQDFAERRLNDRARADYLFLYHRLQEFERRTLKRGRRLRVPPSLRHRVRAKDDWTGIAMAYYRDKSPRRLKLLKLYNNLKDKSLAGVQTIRIPLDLQAFDHRRVKKRQENSPKERVAAPLPPKSPTTVRKAKRTRHRTRKTKTAKKNRVLAKNTNWIEPLERLNRHYMEGEYDACERQAKEMLNQNLPKEAQVSLLRLRAFSLVALGRNRDAQRSFQSLLALRPDYPLDTQRTSPKILAVFLQAGGIPVSPLKNLDKGGQDK